MNYIKKGPNSKKSIEYRKNHTKIDNIQKIKSQIKEIFDQIHERIYSQGGIKPVNAAIDELGKLIFIWIHLTRNNNYVKKSGRFSGYELKEIFSEHFINENFYVIIDIYKELFQELIYEPEYQWFNSTGKASIFPLDEPFRISNAEILRSSVISINKIGRLINKLDNESLRTTDLLGDLYETFLRGKYDSSGGLGTYLTPTEVTKCICEMALNLVPDQIFWEFTKDSEGKRIPTFLLGDICCGTGRFLIDSLKYVEKRISDSQKYSVHQKQTWLSKIKKVSFFGTDQSVSSLLKARLNILLYDGNFSRLIKVSDSIISEDIDQFRDKFTILLANPPFGENTYSNKIGLEKMRRRDLGLELGWSLSDSKKALESADPALLFLDRNLQLLRPGGILGIVLPDGLLNNNQLIKYLFGTYNNSTGMISGGKSVPIAVVSLPTVTFSLSGAVAKTSFLLLKKKENFEDREPNTVFLARALHIGFLKKGNVTIIDPHGNDLLMISELFEKSVIYKKLNHTSLPDNISLIHESKIGTTLDPESYDRRIQEAMKIVEKSGFDSIKVKNIANIRKGSMFERTNRTKYYISILHVNEFLEIDWYEASQHHPSSKGQKCYPGDVLYSCINPAKPRIASIPQNLDGEILCSPEFAVLQVKEKFDPQYLTMVLRLPTSVNQIVFKATGTSSSRRRLKKNSIGEILIPIINKNEIEEITEKHTQALKEINIGRATNIKLIKHLEELVERRK